MKYLLLVCFTLPIFAANYAVIIQGSSPSRGMFPESQDIAPTYENYENRSFMDEFWQDCLLLWQALQAAGIPRENIWVLWGDGSQWGMEQPGYQERYRVPFVDMSASRRNLDSICAYLASILTDQDLLFIYTFNHGGYNILCLYDGIIYDYEFAALFNRIPYRYRWIGMQQCNSGSFIDVLENEKTIMMTSTDSFHYAWRADNILAPGDTMILGSENEIVNGRTYNHGEWNTHLLTAFWGGLMPSLYYSNPIFRDSIDTDGNGKISLTESHIWILKRDTRYEFPQLSDLGNFAKEFYIWPTIEINTGVAEEQRQSITHSEFIHVYPNPSAGRINFTVPVNQSLTFRIFDVNGRLVIETSHPTIQININGVYFYQIERNNRQIQKGKIIIVK